MTDLASISDDWWHGGVDDWIENERRTTAPYEVAGAGNPFYHLRGGADGDDELARRMAEYLAPHISKGVGQVADGIQDFFKSPEQREQEKRDKEALEEAERKKKEREEGSWSSLLSPFFHLSGGAIDKYIAMAKEFAKRAGYKDWDSLRRADDGEHKLELRGVKFGRKGYGDFIKYSLEEGVDEAQKHRDAYLSRATKIKGDWAEDMYSPNSLAINILWDGKSSCPMSGSGKTDAELEAMSVVKLIDYGKSLGVKGLDGKTKKVIMDKILTHTPKEVVAEEQTFIADPDYPEQEEIERILRNSKEETVKEVVALRSLEELRELAKELGVERILHKNKRQLAEEAVDILMDKKRMEYEDEGRLPRRWTGIRNPDGVPMVKVGHYIRKATKAELKAGHPLITEAQKRENEARERDAIEARKMSEDFHFGSGKPVLAPQDVLEGKKDNPIVEETIEEPMDDSDIRQYLPNAKVMRYSGLARLSDIEQLLPTDKSYVILLYENTPGSGHWVALMRYGKTIEFFCSYGSKIDAPLRWQNPKDNAMLGQSRPFLSILLNKAKGKFRAIHNPVAYQSSKQGVATCGAWDVMRINQMKNHNQDLHEFHDFMESVKKETGLSMDEIIVNFVSKR